MQHSFVNLALLLFAALRGVRSMHRRVSDSLQAGSSRSAQTTEHLKFDFLDWQFLWDGLDADSPGQAGSASFDSQVDNKRPKPRVHVLGLQDTGTNLLFSILWKNFRNQLDFFDSSFRDTNNLRQSLVWKHANVKELAACNTSAMDSLGQAGVTALAVVRDPMSWFQSIKKAPYVFDHCVEQEGWLSKPCTHEIPAGFAKCGDTGAKAPSKKYGSLGSVWAEWNSAYANLTDYGFADAMILRYEDLVQNPNDFIADIVARMNLELPSSGAATVENAAKNHGDALGRDEALVKVTQRTYMLEYGPTEAIDACESLQEYRDLMREYRYDDCDKILSDVTADRPKH